MNSAWADPGTCVFMPRDIPHAWKNSGSEPGGVFFIYTPGEAGKVFEEQTERRGAIVNGPEAAQLMRRHGWGIVGTSAVLSRYLWRAGLPRYAPGAKNF